MASQLEKNSNGRFTAVMFDPRKIKVTPGYNVRDPGPNGDFYDPVAFQELKDSILANGVQVPITVSDIRGEKGVPEVQQGHRRLAAVMALIAEGHPIESIPCILVRKNELEATIDLIVSNSGSPLTLIQKGEVYRRLENVFRKSRADIAKTCGVSRIEVDSGIALLELPQDVQDAVKAGKISPHAALEVAANSKSADETKKTVEEAVTKAGSEGRKATHRDVKTDPDYVIPLTVSDLQKLIDAMGKSIDPDKKKTIIHHLKKVVKFNSNLQIKGVEKQFISDFLSKPKK